MLTNPPYFKKWQWRIKAFRAYSYFPTNIAWLPLFFNFSMGTLKAQAIKVQNGARSLMINRVSCGADLNGCVLPPVFLSGDIKIFCTLLWLALNVSNFQAFILQSNDSLTVGLLYYFAHQNIHFFLNSKIFVLQFFWNCRNNLDILSKFLINFSIQTL